MRKPALFAPVNWIVCGTVAGKHVEVQVSSDVDGYAFAFMAAEKLHPGITVTAYRRVS